MVKKYDYLPVGRYPRVAPYTGDVGCHTTLPQLLTIRVKTNETKHTKLAFGHSKVLHMHGLTQLDHEDGRRLALVPYPSPSHTMYPLTQGVVRVGPPCRDHMSENE